jgi:hypothetical protein
MLGKLVSKTCQGELRLKLPFFNADSGGCYDLEKSSAAVPMFEALMLKLGKSLN